MIAHVQRVPPGAISAASVLVGFGLMMSGVLPLGVAGAGFILLAFFVPFLRLPGTRDISERPEIWMDSYALAVERFHQADATVRTRKDASDIKQAEQAWHEMQVALDQILSSIDRAAAHSTANDLRERVQVVRGAYRSLCQLRRDLDDLMSPSAQVDLPASPQRERDDDDQERRPSPEQPHRRVV